MNPALLSQRDPKWKDIKLGFSKNTTISSHGCTITCVSMKFGVTPDVVNERLKAVEGYLSENLVIWKKLEAALPGVIFKWKHNEYDNEVVKQNIPCVVEVDGAVIGSDRHWVLFVGNQKMFDPWDGKEKPTNTYGMPISFVVLEGQVDLSALAKLMTVVPDDNIYKGLDLANKKSMMELVDLWERVVKKGEFIEKKKHDEMMLVTQEAAKKQRTGVLSNDEADKLKEELEALVKGSGSIQAWAQRTLDFLKNKTPEVKKETAQEDGNGVNWFMKLLEGVKK